MTEYFKDVLQGSIKQDTQACHDWPGQPWSTACITYRYLKLADSIPIDSQLPSPPEGGTLQLWCSTAEGFWVSEAVRAEAL